MNMYYKNFRTGSQKKAGGLLNFDHEQVYLFYIIRSLEKTTKYNLGGSIYLQLQHVCLI